MGSRTGNETYTADDYARFAQAIDAETERLLAWGREGAFASGPLHIGEEIEICLIDDNYQPVGINRKFLAQLENPHVTEELAAFNIEYNPPPVEFSPGFIGKFHRQFVAFMQETFNVAEHFGVRLLMAGILPTVTPGDLAMSLISDNPRYRTIVKRFAEWKKDDFCTVDIKENDGLRIGIGTILMEAVTTSHQVHVQVNEPESGTYYNCAQLLAGPMLALGANSPYFLGCNLWAETRVPVFEQILGPRFQAPGPRDIGPKDFFGYAYVDHSVLELFAANRDGYALLLPGNLEATGNDLPHVALHNGTIWRWNRPVLGVDASGAPTIRIEHRCLPSGPTNADMCANLALFVGACFGLANGQFAGVNGSDFERMLPFADVRANFYACALHGLDAEVAWLDGRRLPVRDLLGEELVPLAIEEFKRRAMSPDDMKYLDIASARAANGNNGTRWQRDFMAGHGGGSASLRRLAAAYWRRQVQGMPVHMWTL